jgi:cation/acetate symporter
MVVGFMLTVYYILRVEFDSIPWLGIKGFNMEPWFYVHSTSAGVFGVVAGFMTNIVVSLMTKPHPGAERFLAEIRRESSEEGGRHEK